MTKTEQLRAQRDAAERELAEATKVLSQAQSRAAKARKRYKAALDAYVNQREQDERANLQR